MHTVLIYIRPKIAMCPVHYIVLGCVPYTTLYCDVSRTLHCSRHPFQMGYPL